jgi:hypothetical protein
MKKPTAKAIAAAKIAIAMENATAAEGSRNLVLLRRSPLPSPLLPAMLLSTPKKSSPQSPERGGHEKRFGFSRYVGGMVHMIKML